ncbi:MAG: hypothetical protein HOE90_03735 [Bacteriovoracaceae bacterium]|nr:hypothetical protein [Bacteriovoracaceae bacterium]
MKITLVLSLFIFFSLSAHSLEILNLQLSGSRTCALVKGTDGNRLECFGLSKGDFTPPIKNLTNISVGGDHMCSIISSKLRCWGNAMDISLDVDSPRALSSSKSVSCLSSGGVLECVGPSKFAKLTPPKVDEVIKISLSPIHGCLLNDKIEGPNEVLCWGDNRFGKVDVPLYIKNPVDVVVGASFSCVIDQYQKEKRRVVCWGRGKDGELAIPSGKLNFPLRLSAGKSHLCVLDQINHWQETQLFCWGKNTMGQIDVPSLKNPLFISSGANHSCAYYDESKELACFGSNYSGEGDILPLHAKSTLSKSLLVVKKELGLNKSSVSGVLSTGFYHSCVIDKVGVKCWGSNSFGQTEVPKLRRPTYVTAGGHHTCALDSSGVKCWGKNNFGQTDVPKLNGPIQVLAGAKHTCALDQDGVKCWGSNTDYQLKIPVLDKPIWISRGYYHNCARDKEGVKCWGKFGRYNGYVVPPVLKNTTQMAGSDQHVCAIDSGVVKCWGVAKYGATIVPRLTAPTQIATGERHICAIENKTKANCWGTNKHGQLNPPTFNKIKVMDAFALHSCALDADGVKCWGWNKYGQNDVPKSLVLR